MHLVLKYILILFITCSRECHANRPHFLVFVKIQRGKRLRSQTKEVVGNVYFKELNRHQQTQGPLKRAADATGDSCASIKRLWKRKLTLLELLFQLSLPSLFKRFFSEPWWFIVALNCKRQYLIIILIYSNNCYNITSAYIIRTVILKCHVTHG